MDPRSIRALQAGALVVPTLQRGDELNASQIRRAVMAAVRACGGAVGAERAAREFGDHPQTGAVQMSWARATAAILEGHPVPGTRQMALAGSSALGRKPGGGILGDRVGVVRSCVRQRAAPWTMS